MTRRARLRFCVNAATFFLICCALVFFIFPRFQDLTQGLAAETSKPLPAWFTLVSAIATWFKYLGVFVAIGLGVLGLMVIRGYFDTFLPLMNLGLLLLSMAVVGLCFFVLYAPTMLMTDGLLNPR